MIKEKINLKINGSKRFKGRWIIKNIIKENNIEYSKPMAIGGELMTKNEEKDKNNGHEFEIETIIENEEVVGIIHHCQCGKSTEIRFDY